MVTALTGIDALSHALETYVCRRRNPVSMLYSREAWRLLATNFLRVWSEPDNLTARGAMQLGAAWAGVAIEHSMLGAAHSLANPLTARHGTVHGQAVAVGLPHVIRFNGEVHDDWYRELLLATSDSGITPPPETGARGVADFFNSLVESCGLHSRLADFGVTREELPGLATEAAQQWTAQFNPRQVSREDLLALYEQAF
jgi:alcohol dehydrogenase